jgi:multiple sugar transport system ATP-binding protein
VKRASAARHRLRVPAVRALSAHERAREHRLSLKCEGMPRRRSTGAVEEARASAHRSSARPPVSGLAGGDRQRVALGRAIVRRPKCFLMDEPLGALDTEFREADVRRAARAARPLGATTVYVTHDQLEAMAMADKIAVMNNGVVEQVGTPQEIYDRPASLFVADFIGSPPMNFLPFRGACKQRGRAAIGSAARGRHARGARGRRAESDLVLGVRPEHVVSTIAARCAARSIGAEYLGTTQIVTVTTRYGAAQGAVAGQHVADRREHVGLDFRPIRLSLFDKASGRAIRTALA